MAEQDYILETRRLVKEFKGFVAVDDVNLRVQRGHIHALIGPTAPARHRLQPADQFPSRLQPDPFNGHDTTEKPAQIAPRDHPLVPDLGIPNLTVLDNVRIGLQRARYVVPLLKPTACSSARRPRARSCSNTVGLRESWSSAVALRPQARARDRHDAGHRPADAADEPRRVGHEDVER